jgi:hypothetical protein
MAGLYPIATRAPGTLITALIYNTDHQAHVDGRAAALMQSYGTTRAQMNLTEDPYPSNVESLPTTLAGEIARLRFVIAELKASVNGGVALNWYDTIAAPGFETIGARVARASSLSVSSGSPTVIDFTGATADFNSGVWEGVTHPTRFTAPYAGKYFAAASVLWEGINSGGRSKRQLQIGVNGTFSSQAVKSNIIKTGQQRQTVSGLLKLAANDYVEFSAYQDSGSTIHLLGSGSPLAESIAGALVFLGT